MKKELEYFEIDGAFGGNQEWFTNVVMNIGGCGAATACDCCIYFAKTMGFLKLYPYKIDQLSKEDYKKFSQIMKPYIKPRVGGVKKLSWFIEGFRNYVKDTGENVKIKMEEFSGERTEEEAEELISRQIDEGIPVPCLLLHHKDKDQFKDFIWHWFLIIGYEKTNKDFKITVATYGEKTTFILREMWDTGFEEKGGLVTFHFTNERLSDTIKRLEQ
ncbi:MAG: hypothetical protein ACI4S2_12895 [Lachnospiraceae bacterium]